MKKILSVILLMLSIALLPNSANALIPSVNVELVGTWRNLQTYTRNRKNQERIGNEIVYECVADSQMCQIQALVPRFNNNEIKVKPGQYAEYTFYIKSPNGIRINSLDNKWDISVVGIQIQDMTTGTITYYDTGDATSSVGTFSSSGYAVTITYYNGANYDVSVGLESDATYLFGILSHTTQTIYVNSGNINIYNKIVFDPNNSASEEAAADDLKGQENIQNQDTTGNNQGVNSEEATNMIGLLSNILNKLTNIEKADNCNLPINLGFITIPSVDLCAIAPPKFIQLIGSILLIFIVYPMFMSLFKIIMKRIKGQQE